MGVYFEKTFSFQSCSLKKLFDQRKENFYLGYLTVTNYIVCLLGYLRKWHFQCFIWSKNEILHDF